MPALWVLISSFLALESIFESFRTKKILQLMKTPIGSLLTIVLMAKKNDSWIGNHFSGIETELAIIREITVFEK